MFRTDVSAHLYADPDPACHLDEDADLDPGSQNDADPDTQHCQIPCMQFALIPALLRYGAAILLVVDYICY